MPDEKDDRIEIQDKDDKIKELEEELRRSEKNNERQRHYAKKLEMENRDLKKSVKQH